MMLVDFSDSYWQEVEQSLLERSKFSRAALRREVEEYVARLAGHDVADLIYHREPDDIAAEILRSRRYSSDYPLPGGVESYFETLVELLRFVADGTTTSRIRAWFQERFEIAGPTALKGYVHLPARMGFYTIVDGRVSLTNLGSRLIDSVSSDVRSAKDLVAGIKLRTVKGYSELLQYLAQAPRTVKSIVIFFNTELGLAWKTDRQPTFRVNWLRSLGLISEKKGQITITGDGLRFLNQSIPSHVG